ncbi:MAG: peroxide stress protein YaaA [Pseudohongiella sp.]
MLLVLSPAKSLDFDSPVPTGKFTQPGYLDDSAKLIETLRQKSPEDLSQLMHISAKLGELNFRRNLNWQIPFDTSNARQAIYAFTGDVYLGLDARALNQKDMAYAQNHVRILSGLYSLLRPLDLMQPYRLEMGTSLQHDNNSNLYQFWGSRLSEGLNQAMAGHKSRTLLNLASNEYFRAVDKKVLDADIISPVFRDYKNGQYKIISFFAKKARGMMAAHVIKNRIDSPAGICEFDMAGYRYSAKDSTATAPVFLRKQA